MEGVRFVIKKGSVRCAKCIYRAPENSGYLCDFAAITGHTRGAVPISLCSDFSPGNPIAQMKRVGWNGEERPLCQPRNAKKKGHPRYDWAKIRKLYDAGMSDYKIATVVGCKRGTVLEWRKREGLNANGQPGRKRT